MGLIKMARVYKNFELGAGLTFQQGPFKFKKNEQPPVQRVSWKGGGVPAGGQQHAGNGNWMSVMTPSPMLVPKIAPGVAQDNPTSYSRVFNGAGFIHTAPRAPGQFQTLGIPIGFPEGSQGVQKAGLGVNGTHRGVNKANEAGIFESARTQLRQQVPQIAQAAQQAYNAQAAIRYPAERAEEVLPPTGSKRKVYDDMDEIRSKRLKAVDHYYPPNQKLKFDFTTAPITGKRKADEDFEASGAKRSKAFDAYHESPLSIVGNLPGAWPTMAIGPQADATSFNIGTELEHHRRSIHRVMDLIEPVAESMDVDTRHEVENMQITSLEQSRRIDRIDELREAVVMRIEHLQDLEESPYVGPTVVELPAEISHAKGQLLRIDAAMADTGNSPQAKSANAFLHKMIEYQPIQEKNDIKQEIVSSAPPTSMVPYSSRREQKKKILKPSKTTPERKYLEAASEPNLTTAAIKRKAAGAPSEFKHISGKRKTNGREAAPAAIHTGGLSKHKSSKPPKAKKSEMMSEYPFPERRSQRNK